MKKIIFFTFFFAQTIYCSAQVEIKVNPLGLLFSSPDVSAEFSVSRNVALEPIVGISYVKRAPSYGFGSYTSIGSNFGIVGKYYFSPVKGFDKVYMGLYARKGAVRYSGTGFSSGLEFSNDYLVAGGVFGYKWVVNNNFILDFATGVGKKVENKYKNTNSSSLNLDKISDTDVDYMLRLGIGYRFSSNLKKGSYQEDF
jgi:Protein of unknown function (DUF3575)